MSKMNLKAQLTGTGVVNNAYVYFERLPTIDSPFVIPIGLFPKNSSRKEWNNNLISIEVVGDLEIQLNVHAFKGTEWSFKLIHVVSSTKSKEIFSATGKTGDKPENGINVSIIKDTINIQNNNS